MAKEFFDDGDVEYIDEKEEIEDVPDEDLMMQPREHLESILYQFVNLYERWSEDRQVAAKQGADMAKLVKAFSEQVENFETLEETVRENIQETIHAEAKKTAVFIGKTVGDAASKDTEATVRMLNSTVRQAETTLSRYQSDSRWEKWKMVGIAVFCSIAVSLLISWLLMPYAIRPLTKDQLATYHSGEVLENVWPKLSEKERNWILDIYKGKTRKQALVR